MFERINHHSEAYTALTRYTKKFDAAGNDILDVMQRQADGEKPDPGAFMRLLEARATAQDAMKAQLKLHEKPLKTVMNETK